MFDQTDSFGHRVVHLTFVNKDKYGQAYAREYGVDVKEGIQVLRRHEEDLDQTLRHARNASVWVEIGIELCGVFPINLLAFVRYKSKMTAKTEIAQTNPGHIDSSVLYDIRKAEAYDNLHNKHDAVHCFVGVVIQKRWPNETHAVEEVAQRANSSHKVVARRIAGRDPVNFVLVRDEEAKEKTQEVHHVQGDKFLGLHHLF